MRPVFNDTGLEQQFDKDGFVSVDLLSEQELNEVRQLLLKLKELQSQNRTIDSSYKLSFFDSDAGYRKRVFDEIAAYFQPKVDVYLKDYIPLIINVFDKEPGGGEVPVHQNWTFVDESAYTSVSVWIPLQDVSRANGTLEVVKGSHRVLAPYRSPSIPWVFEDLYNPLREKYLQPFEFKAGTVGIIDDSILHWSSENKTDKVRTAIQLIMIPADATPIHYYRDAAKNPNEVEVYKVDPEFFTKFDMRKKPEGVEQIGTLSINPVRFTETELLEKIAVNNPDIFELA